LRLSGIAAHRALRTHAIKQRVFHPPALPRGIIRRARAARRRTDRRHVRCKRSVAKETVMPNRMDSILSKGAGVMKGVKARLDGLHGVFKTLAEQHGEVSSMLRRLQDKPEKKAELWPEIVRELLSHERAEMREIYPVLRQHPHTRALAEHHDQEAADLERLIEQLELGMGDWRALYDQLVDTVVRHAHEEENEIFPKAQAAIGDQMTKDLEARFLATKKQIAARA
jgi:hemerythrin superfamily protein